jgi:carboxymethylenebutenolidase
MFHYAGNDQRINEGIAPYEAALKADRKRFVSYLYEGKQHGFHNDTTPRYDEASARLAWTRTLDWFNKHLR